MKNISIKKPYFYLIPAIILIFVIFIAVYITKQKPAFQLKDEQLIDNYTTFKENEQYSAKLYKQDVLVSGKISETAVNKYVDSISIPDEAEILIITFYDSYNGTAEQQSEANRIYEIEKKLI